MPAAEAAVARSSLWFRSMLRRSRIVVLGGLIAVLALIVAIARFDRPLSRHGVSVPESRVAVPVTVHHELVSAAMVEERRVITPPAQPRLHRAPTRTSKGARIAARAGRLLLGDGRYRPEPFPRGH